MPKLKLTGKQLRAIGLPEGPVISIAMNIMEKNYKHHTEEEALDILRNIVSSPADYVNDEILGMVAKQLVPKVSPSGGALEGAISLSPTSCLPHRRQTSPPRGRTSACRTIQTIPGRSGTPTSARSGPPGSPALVIGGPDTGHQCWHWWRAGNRECDHSLWRGR